MMNIPVAYLRIIKNRRRKGEYVNIAVHKHSDQHGHSVEGRGEGGGAGLKPKPPEATVCASSCGFACARRVRSCCGGSRKGGARMGGQSPGFSSDCPVSGRGSLASLGSGSWSCLLHPLHPKVAVFLQASDQHFPPSFLDELVQGCLLSAPS